MKNSKLIAFLLIIIGTTTIFVSCKKNSVAKNDERTTLLKSFQEKIIKSPVVTTEILQLKGKGYYGDINGNKISTTSGLAGRGDASSCPDPGDSEFDQEFVSMDREFTCGVGYRFLVTYKVTSEFYPVLSSGSNVSVGRVRLRNGSTTIYTTPNAPVISIVNNGVVGLNSLGEDLNEFLITYRTDIVPEATYNNATAIQPNLFAYTDCVSYPTLSIGFSTQQSAVGSQHTSLPCLRVDKIYWNPSSGTPPTYSPPSIAGANVFGSGCFPYGYVLPEYQELQFKNGSGVWKSFYMHINGLANPGVETDKITIIDVWYLDLTLSASQNGLVTGNVDVRYRNKITSSSNGGPCVTEPADTWVYETWYLN